MVVDGYENTNDNEKRGDGSTQVREFFNSIKKCRDSRPSPISTQQLTKSKDDDSDTDEELPNGKFFVVSFIRLAISTFVFTAPPQQIEVIDYRDPEDFWQSERFSNGPLSTVKKPMVFSMSLAVEVDVKKVI